jgi:hypothetical protein
MIISKNVTMQIDIDIESHNKCGKDCGYMCFGICTLFGTLRTEKQNLPDMRINAIRADRCKEIFNTKEQPIASCSTPGFEIDTTVASA